MPAIQFWRTLIVCTLIAAALFVSYDGIWGRSPIEDPAEIQSVLALNQQDCAEVRSFSVGGATLATQDYEAVCSNGKVFRLTVWDDKTTAAEELPTQSEPLS